MEKNDHYMKELGKSFIEEPGHYSGGTQLLSKRPEAFLHPITSLLIIQKQKGFSIG